jgi:hypothetical protein
MSLFLAPLFFAPLFLAPLFLASLLLYLLASFVHSFVRSSLQASSYLLPIQASRGRAGGLSCLGATRTHNRSALRRVVQRALVRLCMGVSVIQSKREGGRKGRWREKRGRRKGGVLEQVDRQDDILFFPESRSQYS